MDEMKMEEIIILDGSKKRKLLLEKLDSNTITDGEIKELKDLMYRINVGLSKEEREKIWEKIEKLEDKRQSKK
jgi:hypothetical protein